MYVHTWQPSTPSTLSRSVLSSNYSPVFRSKSRQGSLQALVVCLMILLDSDLYDIFLFYQKWDLTHLKSGMHHMCSYTDLAVKLPSYSPPIQLYCLYSKYYNNHNVIIYLNMRLKYIYSPWTSLALFTNPHRSTVTC